MYIKVFNKLNTVAKTLAKNLDIVKKIDNLAKLCKTNCWNQQKGN